MGAMSPRMCTRACGLLILIWLMEGWFVSGEVRWARESCKFGDEVRVLIVDYRCRWVGDGDDDYHRRYCRPGVWRVGNVDDDCHYRHRHPGVRRGWVWVVSRLAHVKFSVRVYRQFLTEDILLHRAPNHDPQTSDWDFVGFWEGRGLSFIRLWPSTRH